MWSPRVVRPLEIGIGLKLVAPVERGKWLRKALDGAGPTYIKVGQFISNRPDIFGKEFSAELAPSGIMSPLWSSVNLYLKFLRKSQTWIRNLWHPQVSRRFTVENSRVVILF